MLLLLPCNQLFFCNIEFLFPIIQIDVEERTGNPEHWVVLEVEEPKKKKKKSIVCKNKQTKYTFFALNLSEIFLHSIIP